MFCGSVCFYADAHDPCMILAISCAFFRLSRRFYFEDSLNSSIFQQNATIFQITIEHQKYIKMFEKTKQESIGIGSLEEIFDLRDGRVF